MWHGGGDGAVIFQSTLPVWGGTKGLAGAVAEVTFQSTLPVWGGTPVFCTLAPGPAEGEISIHPPRVGRDSKSSQKFFVNFCARRQYYQNF